jgi:hypothetical protein
MAPVRGRFTALASVAALVLLAAGAAGYSLGQTPLDPRPHVVLSPPPPPPPRLTALSLCGSPDRLTALTAIRTDPFPENRLTFVSGATVSSSDAMAIAAVARTACGLVAFPSVAFSCPADFGVTYSLTFTAGRRVVQVITARPAGCPSVAGLGPDREASPAFWTALATALGLPVPSPSCNPFAGQLPADPVECGRN